MKRKILIALLALGTVGGFAAGCSRMHHHRWAHHDQWKKHVAEVCVRAAERVAVEKRAATSTQSDAL